MKKLLFLFTLLILANTAKAGTVIVQNTNDNGVGSLRQATIDALEGDTIRFNPAIIASGSDTINLTSEIAFNKGLVFKGLYNATDTLFVSGQNSVRIFNIDLSSASNKNLILDSMCLVNGASAGDGGGVYVYNSVISVDVNVIITNSAISNNSATGKGGGVYVFSEWDINLAISNSTISNNSTTGFGGNGGGVYAYSFKVDLDVTNSTISNNSTTGFGGNGGGVYVSSFYVFTAVDVTNSTFSNNSASSSGGGIYASYNPMINVTNSTISNNSANSGGGGICASLQGSEISGNISFWVTNCTISNNSAPFGGGIYSNAGISNGNTIIKSSVVALNGNNNLYLSPPYSLISQGNNIFSDPVLVGSQFSDYLGVTSVQLNLDTLKNNGGTTLTMIPKYPSIAINNGSSDPSAAQNIPINGTRDIGAAEYTGIYHTIPPITDCDSSSINSTWYDSSQVITYALNNVGLNGEDSVITVSLTINNSVSDSLPAITNCDSVTHMGTTYYNDTVLVDINSTLLGCDSIIFTPIVINNPQTINAPPIVACDSTFLNGNWYYNSQVVNDSLSSLITGCDSIIVTAVIINQSVTTNPPLITNCDSIVYLGTTYFNDTTLTMLTIGGASNGCDLTTIQQLFIDSLDTNTTLNGLTITANQTGAIYQWIDCNNGGSEITGETNQSFTAFTNGDYAVIITNGSCIDTSACVTINTVGIDDVTISSVKIYPNPTNGVFTIDFGASSNTNTTIDIIDAIGKTIKQINTTNQLEVIDLSRYQNGIYFIKMGSTITRIIKQ